MRTPVIVVLLVLSLATLALWAQPEMQRNGPAAPPPPPAQPGAPPAFDVFGLMTQTNAAINELTLRLFDAKRLEAVTEEGLLVANFTVIPENAGDNEMAAFIIPWIREKFAVAMIRNDEATRFFVIDAVKVNEAIKQRNLDAAAMRDPKNWAVVGQATGAKYLVTGTISVMPMAEKPLTLALSISARVVALDSGRSLAADSIDFVFRNGEPAAQIAPPLPKHMEPVPPIDMPAQPMTPMPAVQR